MSTMLDILVIIIVAVFAFLGFKKGLAKTTISIVGTFVATILTMFLSNPIAEAIYYGGFNTSIIEKVNDASRLLKQSGQGTLMEKILETMPHFVNNSLSGFGISHERLSSAAANSPEKVEELLRPIVISFISVIVSLVLFILVFIIIKIISRFICNRIDDSFIGTANRFLGAVIGIIEGFVLIILVSFVLRITVPHLKEVPELINDESISHSTVFKGIYDSPLMTDFITANTESPNTEVSE